MCTEKIFMNNSNSSFIENGIFEKETENLSIPICFLVKEQAKSQFAIQELKKNIEDMKFVQEDLADAIIEIKKYLFGEIKITKDIYTFPSNNAALRNKTAVNFYSHNLDASFKDNLISSPAENIFVQPISRLDKLSDADIKPRFFNFSKLREPCLENDKQDSGLDSDCRENIEANLFLSNQQSTCNSDKDNLNDELWQLLEEIGQKSEILQTQLAYFNENYLFDDLKNEFSSKYSCKFNFLSDFNCNAHSNSDKSLKFNEEMNTTHLNDYNELAGNLFFMSTNAHGLDFNKTTLNKNCDITEDKINTAFRKKNIKYQHKIDTDLVSSILKENNINELRRQILTFLVENAVLQTKLNETETTFASKVSESIKLQQSLNNEVKYLALKNKELQYNMHQQKNEINSLNSKMSLLEHIIYLLEDGKKESDLHQDSYLNSNLCNKHKATSTSHCTIKAELPEHLSNCSFKHKQLDKTLLNLKLIDVNNHMKNPPDYYKRECLASTFQPNMNYHNNSPSILAPMHSENENKLSLIIEPSPVLPLASSSHNADYKFINKEFESTTTKKRKVPDNSDEKRVNDQIDSLKINHISSNIKTNSIHSHAIKFPFNVILEKLKTNSEARISKRFSQDDANVFQNTSNKLQTFKHISLQRPQINSKISRTDIKENKKKSAHSKNIHQRIQDILDRITAESEETN